MYAGEVINYFTHSTNPQAHILANNIYNAAKYHIGDISDLTKIKQKAGVLMFGDKDLRLPYRDMWIDWTHIESKNTPAPEGMYSSSRAGILLVSESDTVFTGYNFRYKDATDTWIGLLPYFTVYIGGIPEQTVKDLNIVDNCIRFEKNKMTIHANDATGATVVSHRGSGCTEGQFKDMFNNTSIVHLLLQLLTCKNIVTDCVPGDTKKRNLKRLHRGKSPRYEYKVLNVIVPRSVKLRSEGKSTVALNTMPLHIMEGHFKNYTSERPLFGKCVGKYWWQQQTRGNKNNGVIEKEYNIEIRT